jgi:hypothetical protein
MGMPRSAGAQLLGDEDAETDEDGEDEDLLHDLSA